MEAAIEPGLEAWIQDLDKERWVGAGGRRAFLFLWGNSLSTGRKAGKPGWGRKENGIVSIHVERQALHLGALEFEVKSAGDSGALRFWSESGIMRTTLPQNKHAVAYTVLFPFQRKL